MIFHLLVILQMKIKIKIKYNCFIHKIDPEKKVEVENVQFLPIAGKNAHWL